MDYLTILYFVFLAVTLCLIVISASIVNEIDIKATRQPDATVTNDKCPGCGTELDAGAIKCHHCAALINIHMLKVNNHGGET